MQSLAPRRHYAIWHGGISLAVGESVSHPRLRMTWTAVRGEPSYFSIDDDLVCAHAFGVNISIETRYHLLTLQPRLTRNTLVASIPRASNAVETVT